jgi:transcriptional regulator with XRE-family HTH domain
MNREADRGFGRHVRSLRRARGLTQEGLAERCGLSTDTIRRLEHGSFSPSLDTLRKLVGGLDILLSTLFEGYELNRRDRERELAGLLVGRPARVVDWVLDMVRGALDCLDELGETEKKRPRNSET